MSPEDPAERAIQQMTARVNEDEAVTWEHWEYCPPAIRTCSSRLLAGRELQYAELADSANYSETEFCTSDCPRSYHIEDIIRLSPTDSVPIISNSVDSMSILPELTVSQSSSPSEDSTYDPWGNASDIPTRPASAILLQDFPPLVRCRDDPAMGFIEDIIIMDLDDDSTSDCFYLMNTNSSKDSTTNVSRSNSFLCKEDNECKENENWSIISCGTCASSPLILHAERNSPI